MITKFNFLSALLFKRMAENRGVDSGEALKIGLVSGYSNFKNPLTLIAPIKWADAAASTIKNEKIAEKKITSISQKILADKASFKTAIDAAADIDSIKATLLTLQ